MNKRTLTIGASTMLLAMSALNAGTLLIDFYDPSNEGLQTSSSADFAAAIAGVDLGATVNHVNGDNANTDLAVAGFGLNATLTEDVGAFSQADTAARGGVPILDGYLSGSFTDINVSIGSLEEILAGTEVTVTVWAVGDQNDQEATGLTLTYNSIASASGSTEATGVVAASDVNSFEQFTFIKVNGVDSLDIFLTNTARYRPLNGIALTYAVPEPRTAALLAGTLALGAVMLRRRRS